MFDINTASITDLKAFAYDQMRLLETVQQNIQLVNNEIARRNIATLDAITPEAETKKEVTADTTPTPDVPAEAQA